MWISGTKLCRNWVGISSVKAGALGVILNVSTNATIGSILTAEVIWMAIDDPLEKIRQLASDDKVDLAGAALQVGGMFAPVFKVVAIAKGVLEGQLKGNSLKIAVFALCDELQRLQSHWPSDFERALETVWFRRAVIALMDQAGRAANDDHARLLGRVAAHGCFPKGQDEHRQEDLASYIQDLARLGTDDIQFLKMLKSENLDAIKNAPNLNLADAFSERFEAFKTALTKTGIDPDDAVSLGARLSGFGLAYEALRNNSRQSPVEHCFRPTKRGLYLLSLLESSELPIENHN